MLDAAELAFVEAGVLMSHLGSLSNSQRTDCSSNLEEVVLAFLEKLVWLPHEHESAKLRFVVSQVDSFVATVLDQRMRSRNGDIVDSNLALVASAHRKLVVLVAESHDVDHSA